MRKLEYFENELNTSPAGKEILRMVHAHMEEVLSLVNNNRKVMIAWQRNKGPEFLTSAMDSGFDVSTKVKKEINGVTLQRLLLHMADALQSNGSYELSQTIGKHTATVMNVAGKCDSLAEVFAEIKKAQV